MQIKSMTLKNIGHFKEVIIPFAPLEEGKPKITIFIGNNGSGKTNILKSLITLLSWLPARIETERGRGLDIPELVIHNEEISGSLSITVLNNQEEYTWELVSVRPGRISKFVSKLDSVNSLANIYRLDLTKNKSTNLPLIVFYPVERSILEIDLENKDIDSLEQLQAYADTVAGIYFQSFFRWFKEQEDIENELNTFSIKNKSIKEMKEKQKNNFFKQEKEIEEFLNNNKNPNREDLNKAMKDMKNLWSMFEDYKNNNIPSTNNFLLDCVKKAIKNFTGFEKIWIQRKSKIRMMVSKNGKELNVLQLSQGEKSLMALVGDIARRLVMLNPNLDNPLEGEGVIIIDEADLHLHPQWQRQLVERLTNTFPNCQFILSTYSPLVISDSKDILVYSLENGEINQLESQYGQDANTVLLNAMDTMFRNENIKKQLDELLDLIQDNELEKAKIKLVELKKELPDNHLEVIKAQLLLKKQEIRNEKNR